MSYVQKALGATVFDTLRHKAICKEQGVTEKGALDKCADLRITLESQCKKENAPNVEACVQQKQRISSAQIIGIIPPGVLPTTPGASSPAPVPAPAPPGGSNFLLYTGVAVAGAVGLGLILRKRRRKS